MNTRTKLIHSGKDRDPYTGASSIPIYQTSTFAQPDPEHPGPYDYARSGNPTREALEHSMALLEGGTHGFAFSSGMAATSSVLLLFKPGDHLVVGQDIYGGTYRVLTGLFKQWKLEVTFADSTNPASIRKAITPSTRALFVETPTNPLLHITDLRAMVKIAREHTLLSIIDNTFMTPYLQRPLELGFDIVVHSATKFLGGHSDLIAGVAVTREEAVGHHLRAIQNAFGAILGPQDCWLVQRGIKTLGIRMDAQQKTASFLATWLSSHPAVGAVHYPGLNNHPGRAIHEGQASGSGAVLSFELQGKPEVLRLLRHTKLTLPAVSLGGVESILSYPTMMSHAAMPRPERLARGITDGLVRLSVGLEAANDLIGDLDSALKVTSE
jgi:cystathionine beta-lyase